MNILKILTQNRHKGDLGEAAAVKLLRRSGYRILERNYVCRNSEIDIIAKKRGVTAFIEVKARGVRGLEKMHMRPASAVDPEKQRKIIKAAEYYRRRNPDDTRMRFDIIEVYLDEDERGIRIKDVKHLEAAFDCNSAYKDYRPDTKQRKVLP